MSIHAPHSPSAAAAPAARPATPYLREAWYAAALSTDVGPEAFFPRTLLDTPVLLYRRADGRAVALHDRCPHRFAPLSQGKRCGDEVACPYHALRFNAEGRCTHNPHGNGLIPQAAQVRSFPIEERHGFLWIWMGETPPDLGRLPDFSPLDAGPDTGIAFTYMRMKAHFELIIDNVMDLSHVDHVHGEIITTRGQLSPLVPQLREEDGAIAARWEWKQTPAMMIFANFMPRPADEARMFVQVNWTPPANIQLSIGATQDEGPMDLQHCLGQYDLHTCTPETADTTHYFFATRRNHLEHDGEFNRMKIQAMHAAFENEDGPIIEAVHQRMGTADFFSLKPVLISSDAAPVRVRRRLAQLIAQETSRA